MAHSVLLEKPEPRKHHNGKLVAWDVDSCMGQSHFMCVRCGSSGFNVQLGGRGYGLHCRCGASYYMYTYRGTEYIKVLEDDDWGRMGFDCPHCKAEMCLNTRSLDEDPKCMECGSTCTFAEASAYLESTKLYHDVPLHGDDGEMISLLGRASYNNLLAAGRNAFDARFETVSIDRGGTDGRTPVCVRFEYTRGENPGLSGRPAGRGRGGGRGRRALLVEHLRREVGN